MGGELILWQTWALFTIDRTSFWRRFLFVLVSLRSNRTNSVGRKQVPGTFSDDVTTGRVRDFSDGYVNGGRRATF